MHSNASKRRTPKPMVIALRRLAHGRKGLDQETYRLHLRAVGAYSTSELSKSQQQQLLDRLLALPDKGRGGT